MNKTTEQVTTILNSCGLSTYCENHRCWYKRRDYHGKNPWYIPKNSPEGKSQIVLARELDKTYGEEIFPEFSAKVGTNCIELWCNNYIKRSDRINESMLMPYVDNFNKDSVRGVR